MPQATLVVRDMVNVKFNGLDPVVRRKINEALKFMVPSARHMPAYKLGRWDGTVSFCTAGGGTYLNLLDRILPIIEEAGYDIEIDDKRPDFDFDFPEVTEELFADRTWPKGHPKEGEAIMLRDYQVAAIQKFLDNLQSIMQIVTGAGKTLLTAALSSLVEPFGRSVVIVPNKSLVKQTEEDYKNIGLDVGVFYGERKEIRTHTIATWQSLVSLAKKTRRGEGDITMDQFIHGVVCVINDEVHSAKGKELKDLLTGAFSHIPVRWGLTGTIPKEDHESMCLLASIGPVVGQIKAIELQEKGVLANCTVEVVQLQDDHVEFTSYDSEHNFLLTDEQRIVHVASMIRNWAKTGNTLVLVDRIETGETICGMIDDAVFVCGSTKTIERQEQYQSIQEAEGKIIIATYGVAAVGINIPRLFNVVCLEAGRSYTRVIQSIGRGLRKAKDKNKVRILDVCSSLKFSKRHLAKRKEFYREAQYPYTVTKIDYR